MLPIVKLIIISQPPTGARALGLTPESGGHAECACAMMADDAHKPLEDQLKILEKRSWVPPGKPGAAFVGQAVFLKRASGLFRNGHFQQSLLQQRIKNLVPELGAVCPPRDLHQFSYSLFDLRLMQDFNLVPTWSPLSPDWALDWVGSAPLTRPRLAR